MKCPQTNSVHSSPECTPEVAEVRRPLPPACVAWRRRTVKKALASSPESVRKGWGPSLHPNRQENNEGAGGYKRTPIQAPAGALELCFSPHPTGGEDEEQVGSQNVDLRQVGRRDPTCRPAYGWIRVESPDKTKNGQESVLTPG